MGEIQRPPADALSGQALIYERANGRVYAKFRDQPRSIDYPGRWYIGGEPQESISYDLWRDLFAMADKKPQLKKQLEKTVNLYYLLGGKEKTNDTG